MLGLTAATAVICAIAAFAGGFIDALSLIHI